MVENNYQLLFLISQPRSGSTLLQRMLGAHPLIHTQSEPWILLYPLHVFKSENIVSSYKSDVYESAAKDFIHSLPGGMGEYKRSIARTYEGFYYAILSQHQKRIFLDKTPRYYHIINELNEYFPKAKFVFLLRNPAAVLVSICNSWIKGNWYYLSEYKEDLLDAPGLIMEGINSLGRNAHALHYEELLQHPQKHIQELCEFIGVAYESSMIEYTKASPKKWKYGDKGVAFEKEMPDIAHINNWIKSLENPQTYRLVYEYIETLGPRLLSALGYSYNQIFDAIKNNEPNIDLKSHSVDFNSLLVNTREILLENKRLKAQLEFKKLEVDKLQNQLKQYKI